MKEFAIRLTSVQDIQKFVALATAHAFPIFVRDRYTQVNGKSFMEMFCLNFSRPLKATMDCSEEEYQQFLRDADALLVK